MLLPSPPAPEYGLK
uniref:Uncharacterized protein n=1 Tax=Anguilla anguilla TaxID=7936 RepID=A0A0E9U0Q7_ANGAN